MYIPEIMFRSSNFLFLFIAVPCILVSRQ